MADVQLEHGHVRIANRLFEAILDAEFTGAQTRILVALIRLTFGWRRRTVTLTVPELAAFCRLQPVGGFRRALRDLVTEGVVVQLEHDRGRSATTYAIQKDFAAWGRYSIAEARLSAVWRERPQSDDDLLSETPQGHTPQPYRVVPTGPKSFDGETVAPPKDSERQGQTDVVDSGAGLPPVPEYALQLTVTANQAITDKWGERPVVFHHAAAHQLAADLRDRGVLLDIARASILDQLDRRRLEDDPPRSIHWFQKGIEQAWAQEQQRQIDSATTLTRPTGSAPSRRLSKTETARVGLAAWASTPNGSVPHGK